MPPAAPEVDRAEIARALALLHRPGDVFEIRAPRAEQGGTVSGYFDDPAAAVEAAAGIRAPGVYVTLNPVRPELLARAPNRTIRHAKTTSGDADIAARRWLLVDLDPERPTKTSASDAEKGAALAKARAIFRALRAAGWPEPVVADSGNGYHLLYRVDLPPDDGGLLHRCLLALAGRWTDAAVTVDPKVSNAARIVKVYGTIARKGDPTPDRPHRLARLLHVPDELAPVTARQLETLAGEADTPPPPRASSDRPADQASVIDAFNAAHDPAALLEQHGYRAVGRRWLAPCSKSGDPGVVLLDGRVYSHHGPSDPLADGHGHDAFDVFRILDHGGDPRAAVRAAAELLGMAARPATGGTVVTLADRRQASDPAMQAEVDRLAALPELDYQRCRTEEARKLGIRASALDKLVTAARRQAADRKPPRAGDPDELHPYSVAAGAICMTFRARDGAADHPAPLCNFRAEIVEDLTIDDGAGDPRRSMTITGALASGAPLPTITLAAERYAGMAWPAGRWGARAIVYAGRDTKDHLRAAIQWLSDPVERRVYAHTGWRRIDGAWYYLHTAGGIGGTGNRPDIEVELPRGLDGYTLPDPPPDPGPAIGASLRLLAVAPWPVSAPLFLAPYRALLAAAHRVDFSIGLVGPTGSRKSELAALVQQHHGARFSGKHLPASWASTGNALERQAFTVKDGVLVVDDFAPGGTTIDISRLHREAERLLRAAGNLSGRARMKGDGGMQTTYYPRGLILSTGEDMPHGQSVRARLLIIEVDRDTVDLATLTECQGHGSAGRFAAALAAFARWLAPRLDDLTDRLPARAVELRADALAADAHGRTPDIVASLYLAAEQFAQFATEHGTPLTPVWLRDIWRALMTAGASQAAFQRDQDPAARFVALIGAALGSGRAHLAPVDRPDDETAPEHADMPGALGWRLKEFGAGEYQRREWGAKGTRLGWYDDDGIYLDPDTAYATAQSLARDQGEAIPVARTTLGKRLLERGHLATAGRGDGIGRASSRKTIGPAGSTRRATVWHFPRECVGVESGPSGPSGPLPNENNNLGAGIVVHQNSEVDHAGKSGPDTRPADPGTAGPADPRESGRGPLSDGPWSTSEGQWTTKTDRKSLINKGSGPRGPLGPPSGGTYTPIGDDAHTPPDDDSESF